MTLRFAVPAILMLAVATPALAQEDTPRFCPNRPGLNSSACTTGEGHASVEIGALGWTIDSGDNSRSDSVSVGDSFLRYGVDDKTEVQLGFTAYTHNYNRVGSIITENGGFSDLRFGVRHNLIGNDGGAVAVAIEPFVTVPVGASSVSAGDWSTGVVIPSSFSLGSGLSFAATGIISAAVDSDGDGRHFSATQYLGLSQSVSDTVGVTGEVGLSYDDDPSGDVWAPVASVSAAWTPKPLLQFDAGTVVALDSDSPDVQLYIGVSTLF